MEELKEIENKLWYNGCLMRSLEAKVERVEPFSDDFENIMQALFRLKEEQKRLAVGRLQITQNSLKNI